MRARYAGRKGTPELVATCELLHTEGILGLHGYGIGNYSHHETIHNGLVRPTCWGHAWIENLPTISHQSQLLRKWLTGFKYGVFVAIFNSKVDMMPHVRVTPASHVSMCLPLLQVSYRVILIPEIPWDGNGWNTIGAICRPLGPSLVIASCLIWGQDHCLCPSRVRTDHQTPKSATIPTHSGLS